MVKNVSFCSQSTNPQIILINRRCISWSKYLLCCNFHFPNFSNLIERKVSKGEEIWPASSDFLHIKLSKKAKLKKIVVIRTL